MNPQHTPGPWTVSRSNRGMVPSYFQPLVVLARNGNMTLADGLGTGPEAEANARLIAAAPELLDAVMEFVRLGKAGADTSWHSQDVQPVIYSMLAAIAKATGGDQ